MNIPRLVIRGSAKRVHHIKRTNHAKAIRNWLSKVCLWARPLGDLNFQKAFRSEKKQWF